MPDHPALPRAGLLVDGIHVGPVEIAARRHQRARGLLGRDGLEGALLLPRTRSVHTFAMRFALDVALCSTELEVLHVAVLGPGRVTWPRAGGRAVLEAEAGAFERWGLRRGSRLALSGRP